jgi:hypothetical protein
MAKKPRVVLMLLAACAFLFGPFALLAEPTSFTRLAVGGVSLSFCYSEGVLRISYWVGEKECQLALSSPQRMGIFMEIAREEVHVSLQFLEEEEQWPKPQVLEEYVLKSRFEVPGWVVVVVQKAE